MSLFGMIDDKKRKEVWNFVCCISYFGFFFFFFDRYEKLTEVAYTGLGTFSTAFTATACLSLYSVIYGSLSVTEYIFWLNLFLFDRRIRETCNGHI